MPLDFYAGMTQQQIKDYEDAQIRAMKAQQKSQLVNACALSIYQALTMKNCMEDITSQKHARSLARTAYDCAEHFFDELESRGHAL